MTFLKRRVFILLMCIVYTLSEDILSSHTENPLSISVCNNDTENGHCETITTHPSIENSTEFNSSSTTEEIANSTVTQEIEENQNISTEVAETTTLPPSSVPSTLSTPPTPERATAEPSYGMHFIPEDICSCDITIVTKLKDFKKLFERRKIYQWKLDVIKEPVFQPVMYRAGTIVWSISNATLSPLVLPNKQITAFCEVSLPVQYLIDWSGSCSSVGLTCTSNSGLSASSYYENVFVIATPQLMNHTHLMYFLEPWGVPPITGHGLEKSLKVKKNGNPVQEHSLNVFDFGILQQQECSYNICLPFSLFLCSPDTVSVEDCSLVDDIEVPSYGNETGLCSNVVKQVKYRLHHNGTLGIIKAEAYFWVVNLKSGQTDLKQTFSVEFVWADAPRRVLHRSGNPGYIFGKPVIAGQKIFRSETEEEPDKEAILLSEEQSKWLTFPKPGTGGLCISSMAEGSRIPVNFGENLLSSCIIQLSVRNFSSPENCSLLQRKFLHMLLGDVMINVTEAKQFNMYVSTFGDANVEETGDWVPVLLENMPILSVDWKEEGASLVCKSVVTSLHINIVTSKVGLATKPQTKILGVAVTFGGGRDLVFDCSPSPCSSVDVSKRQKFEIQSSVSFVDVSKPPVIHFAEPPVYEVKLPYDFFYPFLSSGGVKLTYCCYILSTTILFLWQLVLKLLVGC
ncbi:Tectonic-1 [Gryllus bimaculatus]|nr:Tectonic-1 [Gryllus bimaculatus]